MADEKITAQLNLTGDPSGAEQALHTVDAGMDASAQKAKGLAGVFQKIGTGLTGVFNGISAGAKGIGSVVSGVGSVASAGLGLVGKAAGAAGSLLGSAVAGGATLAAQGVLSLVRTAGQMAGVSETSKKFGKTWEGVLSVLASPIAHLFIDTLGRLNTALNTPAVKQFTQQLAALITLALRPVGAALKILIDGFVALAGFLSKGDIAGAVKSLGSTISRALDALTGGAFTWGQNLITQFVNGIIQTASSALSGAMNYVGGIVSSFLEGHSPPKRGPLATIDRWGIALMAAFMSGFQHADFQVLNQVGDLIRTRLQTAVDKGDLSKTALIPKLLGSEAAVAQALAAARQAGGLTEAIIARVRDRLKDLGPATQDYVEAQLRAVDATRQVEAAQKDLATAQAALTAGQATLTAKQDVVTAIQREQELLGRQQAARAQALIPLAGAVKDAEAAIAHLKDIQAQRAAELIPLQDRLAGEEQQMRELLIAQAPVRQQIRDLTDQQAVAEAEVNRLLAQQAAALAPLQARLAADQERLDALLVAQTGARQQIRDLTDQQAVAEAEVNRLLAAQSAQLATLDGQRQHIVDLQEQQFQAQQALVPLQAAANAASAEAAAHAQANQDAIDGARQALDDQLAAQQALLDGIDAQYAGQIAAQQAILAAVDRKYKAELDGAAAALTAAQRLAAFQNLQNDKRILEFDQQAIAAQRITDPNARIAELARIARARRQYETSAGPALEAARLGPQAAQETLDATKAKADAEKAGAVTEIARLQDVVKAEKDIIQERMTALKREGEQRIAQLQAAADAQKRADAATVAAAQARVQAAQTDIDTRGRAIELAQHDVALAERQIHAETDGAIEVARTRADADRDQAAALQAQLDLQQRGIRDQIEADQNALTLAEQRVHTETDGALEAARVRADDAKTQAAALQAQLDGQQRGLADRIAADQAELDLRKSGLDTLAAQELRGPQARLEAVQRTYDAEAARQQALTDAENAQITKRLQAAQDAALAAQDALRPLQAAVDLAQHHVDAAQKVVEAYQAAAQLAQDRVEAEAKIAALLAQERDLLKQDEKKGKTGGAGGPKPPPLAPEIKNPEAVLKPWLDALSKFGVDAQGLLDPLGKAVDDLFHGHFGDAAADLQTFGRRAGEVIEKVFGPDALAAVRTLTDPLGTFANQVLILGQNIQNGKDLFDSFRSFLVGIGVPPELATQIASFIDALRADLAPILQKIGDELVPKLKEAWEKMQPGLNLILPILGKVAELFGGALAIALTVAAGLIDGVVQALPSLGQAFSGAFEIINGILDVFGGFFQGVFGLIEGFVGFFTGDDGGGLADVTAGFQKMSDGVLGILHGLWDLVQGLAVGAATLLFTAISDLVNGVLRFFTQLKDDLVGHSIIPDMIADILNAFGGLVTGAVEAARKLWDGVTTKIRQLATDAGKTLGEWRDKALQTASDLKDKALSTVGGLVLSAVTKVIELRDKAVSTLEDWRDKAIAAARALGDGIMEKVNALWTDVTTKIRQINTDALATLTKFKDDAIQLVLDLWNGAVDKFNGLKDAVVGEHGIVSQIVSGVLGLLGSVVGAVTGDEGLIAKVKNAITGEVTQLQAVGSSIVDGLIQGIKDAWHNITDAIHDLAENLPQPVKDALHIQSPSKDMAEQGDMIPAGLVLGVDRSAQTVIDALTNLGRRMVLTLRTNLANLADEWGAFFAAGGANGEGGGPLLAAFGAWGPVFLAAWNLFWAPDGVLALSLFEGDDTAFFPVLFSRVNTRLETWYSTLWEPRLRALQDAVSGFFNEMKGVVSAAAQAVGEGIGDGIAAGIQSRIDAIAAAARAAVEAAISAAQMAAQTHSPSLRTMVIGGGMGSGFALGMERMYGVIRRAATGMANVAVAAVQGRALGTVGLAGVGRAGLALAGAGGPARSSTAIDQRRWHIGVQNVYQNDSVNALREQERTGLLTRR